MEANSNRTDSQLSRRIVGAFLEFLESVEPAPGVDLEALQVARDCLSAVFNPDTLHHPPPGLLVNLFRSLEANGERNQKFKFDTSTATINNAPNIAPTSFLAPAPPATSKTQDANWTPEPCTMGVSRDELFGQFFAALERINFFRTKPDGSDDPVLLDKATLIGMKYDLLYQEMEKTGCQSCNLNSIAETLKAQGNRAMQSKLYFDAIELYSCAIAPCGDNAVYYCNRAAAYTQVRKYAEAISDCLKSIEIDPNYSKAYSRLGLVYYAQGHYQDAIDKGFKKALQLDPNNEAVKENIQVAERNLKEERHPKEQFQNSSSSGHDQEFNQWSEGSRSHGMPPPFSSMSFDASSIPADFTSMLQNMAANAMGGHSQDRQGEHSNVNDSSAPGTRAGGNLGSNFSENIPEELRGTFRSMMDMFSGGVAAPHGHPQNNMNGNPSTS